MRRLMRGIVTASAVTIALAAAVPAGAAPVGSSYHDRAFTFAYPSGWILLPRSSAESLTAFFGAVKKQMHVTDVGGVRTPTASNPGAIVAVIRLRLSHATRMQVLQARQTFVRSLMQGITFSARKVLSQGSAAVGGRPGQVIDLIQGGGSVTVHDRIYVVVSSDAKRLYVVYMITRTPAWSRYLPDFNGIVGSMRLLPAA